MSVDGEAREAFELATERIRLRGMIAMRAPGSDGADAFTDQLAAVDARAAAAPSSRMATLAARLGLEPDDVELVWFAVAWASDPMLTPHLHVLVADPQRGATLAAFARISGWAPERIRRLGRRVLRSAHPLFVHRLLIAGAPGAPGPLTPLVVPERLIGFLEGRDDVDPAVAACGERVAAPAAWVDDLAARPLVARVVEAIAGEPVVVALIGPDGVGRRALAARAAARVGREVVAIDLARVPPGAPVDEALHGLRREVVLADAVPLLAGAETTHGDAPDAAARRAAVAGFLARSTATVLVASNVPTIDLGTTRPIVRLQVAVPEPPVRRALWAAALGDATLAPGAIEEVALRFRLVPAAIHRAVAAARMVARSRGSAAPGAAELAEGVRLSTQERLGGLASRVVPRHGWDDLVLPDDTREEVEAVVARARYAYRVLEQWGFSRHVSGEGIAVLFSGPPGTGKTMVAGLIARELGLDLYRVDLSQVVSKWIGESEKQLARLFDAAETGHVLLVFDEADALFAKRTEVKGATERYANLEVNFLLQRIETFAGLAILTTNLDGSIDTAFRRRLAAHVQFPAPGDDERERLWRSLIPANAPTDGRLDLRALAEEFTDFAGGHIRNATLNAAFLAAAEGQPIAQRHLEHAARDVARSLGRVLAQGGRLR